MTIGSVREAIENLTEVGESFNAAKEAKALRALADFLRPFDAEKTSALLQRAKSVRQVGSSWTGQKVAILLPPLVAWKKNLSAKTQKEFEAVLEFLKAHEAEDLAGLFAAARDAIENAQTKEPRRAPSFNNDLVENYAALIKPAFGKEEAFEAVYEALKKDKGARKQEVAAIAGKLMPSPPAPSETKARSLKAIRDVHLAAKGFDLKLKASRGRSAA